MRDVEAIIIGAGQAGLAMSRCLSERGIEHVLLERGRVAERWRTERWDSLHLLTPNWMSRLPGWQYQGRDPDGYLGMPELIGQLEAYASFCRAPVETGTTVRSVTRTARGFRLETSKGAWRARAVVIASGECDRAAVPAMARVLAPDIHQVTPPAYRNPRSVPAGGGVLVVGASATGVQLAAELQQAGHAVTLSVGRHVRLPRLYRGMDILWWMDRVGALDDAADRMRHLNAARHPPSLQLVGRSDRRSIDLATLRDSDSSVRIVGRAIGMDGPIVHLQDDLAATSAASDATLERLLKRIEAHPEAVRWPIPPEPIRPVTLPASPRVLDLRAAGIRTVLWATGFRQDLSWLNVPVLNASGKIMHHTGVTPAPGLYVLGLRFLRTRRSSFIDGVGRDAACLAEHISAHLAAPTRLAA